MTIEIILPIPKVLRIILLNNLIDGLTTLWLVDLLRVNLRTFFKTTKWKGMILKYFEYVCRILWNWRSVLISRSLLKQKFRIIREHKVKKIKTRMFIKLKSNARLSKLLKQHL
jgi:hypothetical protein